MEKELNDARLHEAAKKYVDANGLWNDSITAYKSFVEGSEWKVKNLWRSGFALPDPLKSFIYVTEDKAVNIGIVLNKQDRDFSWDLWKPVRWLYLEDLGLSDGFAGSGFGRYEPALKTIAMRYAAEVADILDVPYSNIHWIGTDDFGNGVYDICDFGDTVILSFADIQLIVNNMSKWVKKYGSRQAVGNAIMEYLDWMLDPDNCHEDARALPKINFKSWMMGLRSK